MSLAAPELVQSIAADNETSAHSLVTASAGDFLVMGLVHDHAPHGIQSVTWNGHEWTRITQAPAGISMASLWCLAVTEDGTNNVVVEFTGLIRAVGGRIFRLPGVDLSPVDRDAAGFGSGVDADSGITPLTAQAAELVFALVMTDGDTTLEFDTEGTWLDSLVRLDRHVTGTVGYEVSMDFAYRIVAAAGQYRAAQTLSRGRPWAALCATFREAVLTTMEPPRTPVAVEASRGSLPVESERVTAQATPTRHSVQVNDEPA